MVTYPCILVCMHISAIYAHIHNINMCILHNSAHGVDVCTHMHIIICLQGYCK